MEREFNPNTFSLAPPKPGSCPVCACEHSRNEPHFPGSAYYIMRFFQQNGRRPTWKDAMAHCPPEIQKKWTDELVERGLLPKEEPKEAKEDTMKDG